MELNYSAYIVLTDDYGDLQYFDILLLDNRLKSIIIRVISYISTIVEFITR